MNNKSSISNAKVSAIKHWSPIWIVPIVAAFIGIWILYSHISQQGKAFSLIASNADGIIAGKTVIKNRNVDVGLIEKIILSDNFEYVILEGRIKKGMEGLLKADSLFWLEKPRIGVEGVSGLGTLFSGVYIKITPGVKTTNGKLEYRLLDKPPLSGPNEKGIRILVTSKDDGLISAGSSVFFRGVRVGRIEESKFNPIKREIDYRLFIPEPFDVLVTENVRFWRDDGLDLQVSPQGISLHVTSFDAVLMGAMSFELPEGALPGGSVKDFTKYELHLNKQSIQETQYTLYKDYLLFFNESISGLRKDSPVEYRGIQIGKVLKAPYLSEEALKHASKGHNIPVLVRLEPGRINNEDSEKSARFLDNLIAQQKNGLRASLKTVNLFTGAMFVDLDFHQEAVKKHIALNQEVEGYPIIETAMVGLSQMQNKVLGLLDQFQQLPIDRTLDELSKTLVESRGAIVEAKSALADTSNTIALFEKNAEKTMRSLQEFLNNLDTKQLSTELVKTLQNFQQDSTISRVLVDDLKELNVTLKKLQPILETVNNKSNALVFQANDGKDPQPKAKKVKKNEK